MNRSEIVKRLMSEGLSSETLSKLNDKQLIVLSKRMLGEQAGTDEKKSWHTFAALRDSLTSKGFTVDKESESYGILQLVKGNDYNGIVVNCKPTTGEWNWGVSINGKYVVNKNYKIDLSKTNTISIEGKKVYDMIMKDITPYLSMKIKPAPNLGEQAGIEQGSMSVTRINTGTPAGKKAAQDLITNPEKIKKGEIYKITEKEKGKGEKETKEELKGGQKKLDKNKNGKLDKEDFKLLRSKKSEVKEDLKGKQSKLDANKNGKIDKEDFKLLKSKKKSEMKEGKSSPFAKEVKEGGKKWIQKAIHPSKKGSLKKALGVKKDETIPAGKLKAAAKKGGKLGQRARLAMTLKKLKESVETEEWVESLVENQYHSIATKKEIMELIQNKMNETEVLSEIPEFMSFDSIAGTKEKEAPTKVPTKEPGEKTPPSKNPSKTPFTPKHPRPAEDPGPKAGIRR